MGLTRKDQGKIVERIHAKGMTLNGWARSRGFSIDTVKNCMYRKWGLGEVGPVTAKIIEKLKEEGLV